jgi:hypothetical protein
MRHAKRKEVTTSEGPTYFTVGEMKALYRCTRQSLDHYIRTRQVPSPIRVGGKRLFPQVAVIADLRRREEEAARQSKRKETHA